MKSPRISCPIRQHQNQHQPQQPRRVEPRPLLDPLLERRPRDVLHHEVLAVLVGADVDDADHVAVLDPRRELRLADLWDVPRPRTWLAFLAVVLLMIMALMRLVDLRKEL